MEAETVYQRKAHYGQNVKRLREMLGIKQEVLADGLGLSQQTISRIESQEELDNDILDKIANVLHIQPDTIKNFDEDTAFNIIHNTFNNDSSIIKAINHNCTFNPIDKIVQLYNEKVELYERMLKTEQDKNALLEKLLADNKLL